MYETLNSSCLHKMSQKRNKLFCFGLTVLAGSFAALIVVLSNCTVFHFKLIG